MIPFINNQKKIVQVDETRIVSAKTSLENSVYITLFFTDGTTMDVVGQIDHIQARIDKAKGQVR